MRRSHRLFKPLWANFVRSSGNSGTATITAGSLTVTAGQGQDSNDDPTAYASSVGGAGGILLGAEATDATASNQGNIQAYTGEDVVLPDGNVTIEATNQTVQSANATAGAAGLVGIGSSTATATSGATTTANLGTDNKTSTTRTGSLSVTATGSDRNAASSTAGSGGLVAGDAAAAISNDTSTASAGIGGGSTIYAGTVTVSATNTDNYAPSASSTNAAALGASGAQATATDTTGSGSSSPTSATVNIGDTNGDDTTINATGTVTATAQNQFAEPAGSGAAGGAGGVANGSAVSSEAILAGTSSVNLGNNVSISSESDSSTNPGGIDLVASSTLNTTDTVTLTSGGALEGASTDSTLGAKLTNSVTTGTGDNLNTSGNIGLGTYTTVNAQTNSEVHTYGLAAVGVASATTSVTTNQSVTVGTNTTMTAFGNVNLTAGNEPTGAFSTDMAGLSNAQSYFIGLFAVPQATAVTTLTSNATLSIDTGAVVSSGQNVTIGAFPGAPSPTADGTAHYDSSTLNTSASSSTATNPTSSSVTEDGKITAGIYHKLDIVIPNAGNAGVYTDTRDIQVNPDSAPFTVTFTSTFSPSDESSYFSSQADATAFDKETSSSPVGALEFGPLYAAGGIVTVNAGTLAGNGDGSITAYGAPTISITNNSPDYLVFDPITIPYLPGGEVLFTGAAGLPAAAPAGISITQSGQGASPVVTIDENYPTSVGTPANGPGPAVYLNGDINNLGGEVAIANVDGSVAQLGAINAEQYNITAPNGLLIISGTNGVEITGSAPYSEWANVMLWPGGNPYQVLPDANDAVAWAANAQFDSGGQFANSYDFTAALIGAAGESKTNGESTYLTSYVFYGGDVPWADNITHTGSVAAANQDSPVGQAYAISTSAGGNDGYFPVVPLEPLSENALYSQANLSGSAASTIDAAQVLINAGTIDLDSYITVGQPNAWSVDLPATLAGLMAEDRTSYDQSRGNPLFELPVAPVESTDSTITAQYNAATNQIILNNVSASSGGGVFAMDGAIISTNTLGHIHVNGGLGAVNIDNETGIPVLVQNVSAGTNALNSTVSSSVDIIDTNQTTGSQQTLYVYRPGMGISTYQGPANQVLGGSGGTLTTGTTASYSPESGLRFQWQLQANLTRNPGVVIGPKGNLTSISPGNWVFTTPQNEVNANDPWYYLDANGTATPVESGVSTPTGAIVDDPSLESDDFNETITGSTLAAYAVFVSYHGGDYSFAANPWTYDYMGGATITLTNSVKADNPIGIDFSGLTSGLVNINSNAPVILSGAIVNPDGNTTITAGGSITNLADASLASNYLTLEATGGSSTVQTVPTGAQQLWNNATGGTFTLSVTVGSQIETAGPLAYNVTAPEFQVALDALPGVQQATVTGAGTLADPWLINGVSGVTPNDQGLDGGSGALATVANGEQRLWNAAEGGTFTITATENGTPETTGSLAYNAGSGAVQTALNMLAGVQVTVTGAGTAGSPWVIIGTGVSSLATNDAGLSFQSTQQPEPAGALELFNDASGGTFTILAVVSGTTEVTDALDYDATSVAVQAALDALAGVQATVTGGGTAGDPWVIIGTGFSSLLVNDLSVSGGTSTLEPAPAGALQLWNNATGGTFNITATSSGTSESGTLLPFNATAAALETALPGVSVTGMGTATDPWLLSGTGLSQITTDDSGLSGSSTIQFVPFVQEELSNNASAGTFTISATASGSTETTGAIDYNASATTVQNALNELSGVQVMVTGSGTTADPWLILGAGFASLVSNDALSGGSSTLAPVPTGAQQLWTTASGGDLTIQMTVDDQVRTATFAFNASAATVQAALDGMDLSVAAQVTGQGTPGDPWLVSGTGVSAISVVPSGLNGGSSTLSTPPANSQLLWNTASGGTFTATVSPSETTSAIPPSASAAAVQYYLNALGDGVQVTVTGSGTAPDPWLIAGSGFTSLFSSSLSGASTVTPVPAGAEEWSTKSTGGSIEVTAAGQTQMVTFPDDASPETVQYELDKLDPSIRVTGLGATTDPWLIIGSGASSFTVTPIGSLYGKFNISAAPANSYLLTAEGGTFTATVFLPAETTGAIAYNASAATVAQTLNSLPFVSSVNVTGGGIATDPWVISGLSSALTTDDSGLAGGVVGSAAAPLNLQTTAGGVLNVQSGNLGVYLDLNSGALIDQVSAGTAGSGYGDVVLSATGDLDPAPGLVAGTINVTGDNITLTSNQGGIGTPPTATAPLATAPLDVSANGTLQADGATIGGTLTASALDDISVEQDTGDLIINTVASATGDVYLDVTNGGILDARSETPAQVLSTTQIEQVWSNLQLRDDDGTSTTPSSAALSGDQTVAVFENQVDVNYLQYWQLLDNGTVQKGTYTLDSTGTAGQTALQLFLPRTVAALEAADNNSNPADADPTDAQIEAYALGVYQQTVTFLNNNLPADWMTLPDFQTFNPNYQYTATAAQVTALTQNSGWTEAELTYAVSATGLSSAATGTPVGTTTPNVSGRNVTLNASGGVGKLAAPVIVSLADLQSGNLTEAQEAALALATAPGDVLLQGTDANDNTVTFELGQQPAGVTLTDLSLTQTAPLFVAATGTFNASAGSSVYLQSTGPAGQDLTIGRVTAGGDVNITAPQNIQSAGTSSVQIVTPGNLTLLAGTGDLGTNASTPLVVEYGGLLESASAGGDIDLQQIDGNLSFDRIVANGTVQLTDLQGGLYQQVTDLPLVASSLTFHVAAGVNGIDPTDEMIVPLEIGLSSPATIAGQAGNSINIDNVQGSLTVAGPTSINGVTVEGLNSISGDVTLQSALSSILDGIDRSGGDRTADITGNNINLTTGGTTGNIGASPAAPLYIDSREELSATTNQNAYIVETIGNLTLNQVSNADNVLVGTVYLEAPYGSIVNGNTAVENVVAENAYLSAGQNVGTVSLPIDTEVSYLEGMATFGSFIASNTGAAVIGFAGGNGSGDAVQAGGEVAITAHSPVTVMQSIISNADIYLTATYVAADDGTDDVTIEPGVTIQSAGNVFLQGGDTVIIDAGATVLAANTVTIQDNFGGGDTSGSTIVLDGTVSASQTDIDGSPYGDTFDLEGVFYGDVSVQGGAGNDTINVNPAGIEGPLTVNGGLGSNTLNVSDTGNGTATTSTLSSTELESTAFGDGGSLSYLSIAVLNISMGSGGNTFFVNSTAVPTCTFLNTGTGADTVNVLATDGPITINTGGGSNVNTVNLGSSGPPEPNNGSLSSIQGRVTVIGDQADTMNVDDSGVTTPQTGTLTQDTVTGFQMGLAGITYSGLLTLNVYLGSGGTTGNTFNIAVAAGGKLPANTTIVAGSGGHDMLNAAWAGDFNGNLAFSRFATSTFMIGGNLNGTLSTSSPGAIASINIGGSITASGTLNVENAGDVSVPAKGTGLLGNIGTMTVGGSIAGKVEVSGNITMLDVGPANMPTTGDLNDLTGEVVVGGGIGAASVSGNVSGRLTTLFTIGSLYIGGSLDQTGAVLVSTTSIPKVYDGTQNLNTFMIGQDLAGLLDVFGAVTTGSIGGSLCYTGVLSAGAINSLSVGDNLAGQLDVIGTLGTTTVQGATPGTINAGEIGTISVDAGYGPLVAQIEEFGVERLIEATVPGAPFPIAPATPQPPAQASPGSVTFKYFYEGLVSDLFEGTPTSAALGAPQAIIRVDNQSGNTAPDQFDLSLVTYSDTGKFNLARLDSTGNSGISGIRNVSVEGNLLNQVTAAAAAFFGGDTSPGGVYLPGDKLASVSVRDTAYEHSVAARSIQAVAFGTLITPVVGKGMLPPPQVGIRATGSAAAELLAPGTAIVQAGSVNGSTEETFRVAFSDIRGVGFFMDDTPGSGVFDSKNVAFTVEGVSTANSSGTANTVTPSNAARGAVVALVTVAETFAANGRLDDSIIESISLHGDGGSFQTQQTIGELERWQPAEGDDHAFDYQHGAAGRREPRRPAAGCHGAVHLRLDSSGRSDSRRDDHRDDGVENGPDHGRCVAGAREHRACVRTVIIAGSDRGDHRHRGQRRRLGRRDHLRRRPDQPGYDCERRIAFRADCDHGQSERRGDGQRPDERRDCNERLDERRRGDRRAAQRRKDPVRGQYQRQHVDQRVARERTDCNARLDPGQSHDQRFRRPAERDHLGRVNRQGPGWNGTIRRRRLRNSGLGRADACDQDRHHGRRLALRPE